MVSREYCLGIVTYVQKFAPGLVNLIKPLKKNKTCLEARIPWKVSSESKVMTKHQCQLKFFIVHKKTQFNMMCSWVIKIAIQWHMHLEPSLKSFWRCFSDFEREKYCKKNPPPPSKHAINWNRLLPKTASSVLKDLLYFPHSWSTALGLPRTNLASSEGGTWTWGLWITNAVL